MQAKKKTTGKAAYKTNDDGKTTLSSVWPKLWEPELCVSLII